MSSELIFQAAFSFFWFVFLGVLGWVAHSTRWSAGRRTTRRTNELRTVALVFAAIYFAGALVYALVPNWILLLSIPLPAAFRMFMIGAAVLGMSILLWALRTLGRNWAPSLSGVRTDTVLVTAGPYKLVRHPIYFGLFVFLVAQALVTANLILLLPTLALVTLLYMQLPEEESMLIERFGDDYREYMKRTPRFIPHPRHES